MSNQHIMDPNLGTILPWMKIPGEFRSPKPCLQYREKAVRQDQDIKEFIEKFHEYAKLAELNNNDDYAQIWKVYADQWKTKACSALITAKNRTHLQDLIQLESTCSKQDAKNTIDQFNNILNCYTPIPTPTTSGLSSEAIAGIVVSSVILLALIIFLIWYVSKHNHKHR